MSFGKLSLFSVAVLLLLIPQTGYSFEQFLNKTFTISTRLIKGQTSRFKFFISENGGVYSYANNGNACSNTGTVGKINPNKSGSYTCPGVGGNVVNKMNVSVNGDSISINETVKVNLHGQRKSLTNYHYSWKIAAGKCTAASARVISKQPERWTVRGKNTKCTLKTGR